MEENTSIEHTTSIVEPAVSLNIAYQNINGDYNKRIAGSDAYSAFIHEEAITMFTTSETMFSGKSGSLTCLPGWKREHKNARKYRDEDDDKSSKRGRGSGGIGTHIHIEHQADVAGFMDSIDNRYITAYVLLRFEVVIINVYIPPFNGDSDYYVQPEKMSAIESIFMDLDKMVLQCKALAYDFAILADGNGRLGEITGDDRWNEMGRRFWWPRIQSYGLEILNNAHHHGVMTWRSKSKRGSEGIMDYVLINKDWKNEKSGISMTVHPFKFGSDHKPIILHLNCRPLTANPSTRRRFWRPFYRVKVDLEDESKLKHLTDLLATRIIADKDLIGTITDKGEHNAIKTSDRATRAEYVNHFYDSFQHTLYTAMIDSGCMRFVPTKRGQRNKDDAADELVVKLLDLYTKLDALQRRAVANARHSDSETDDSDAETDVSTDSGDDDLLEVDFLAHPSIRAVRKKMRRIEREITKRDQQRQLQHQKQFLRRANAYGKDENSKRLFQALKGYSHDHIIFNDAGERTIDDWHAIQRIERLYHEMYGTRAPIYDKSAEDTALKIQGIIDRSFSEDDDADSADYTVTELRKALAHVKVSKAVGLDLIGYRLLRAICTNPDTELALCAIINAITTISCYPDALHLSKLCLIKKMDVVSTFGKLRGINVVNNLKNIIDIMRQQRTAHHVEPHLHPNQAAYRKKVGCEVVLMASHIAVNQAVARHGRVYFDIKDMYKCFDTCNRDMMLIKCSDAGIGGKHIRTLHDELSHSRVHVCFNGKYGRSQPVRNGLPQGFTEAGDIYNLYTADAIKRCNNVEPLIVHGVNLSKMQYSDDGLSLSITFDSAQRIINIEFIENRKINLGVNAKKSTMGKYARSARIRALMRDDAKFYIDGVEIPQLKDQVIQFLGFKHNLDALDFTKYHFDDKVATFNGLRHVLVSQQVLGAGLALVSQKEYWNSKVRTAAIYGLKILRFTKAMYNKIDAMQNQYLRAMLSLYRTSNAATMRIVLGIPPLSDFLAKLKLLFYFDAFVDPANPYRLVVKRNYDEYHRLYIANDHKTSGIKGQYRFPTRDYIDTLEFLGMDDKYIDPSNIPADKAAWRHIITTCTRRKYRADAKEALKKGAGLLLALTQRGENRALLAPGAKPYTGLISNLALLLDKDQPTTDDLRPISKLLFGNSKLRWDDDDSRAAAGVTDADIKDTLKRRKRFSALPRCRHCSTISCDLSTHLIYDCTTFDAVRPPCASHGLATLETEEMRTDWLALVRHIQTRTEK